MYFFEQEAKKRFLISLGYYLAVALIILAVVKFLLSYFLPFIFAGIIAFAVQKPAAKLCKKIRFKRGTLAAILAAVLYLAAASLMIFLFYRLIMQIKKATILSPYIIHTKGCDETPNDRIWVLTILCNPPGCRNLSLEMGPAIRLLRLSRYFIKIWWVSQSTLMW